MKKAVAVLAVAAATAAAAQEALVSRPLRGLRGPVAALLASGAESGGWPAAVRAWSREGSAEAVFVVDAATAGRDAGELEIYAYAMAAGGWIDGFVAQSVPVASDAAGVRFVASVPRPAPEGHLRVLVIEPRTLRYRLLVVEVDGTPPPLAAPPGRWTLARPPAAAGGDLLALDVAGRALAEWLRESAPEPPAGPVSHVERPAVAEAAVPDAGRKRLRALEKMARRGYLEALGHLAAGAGAPEAASLLVPVESAVWRLGSVRAAEAASRGALAKAEELGRVDAEALLPIALLHFELFRLLVAAGEHFPADQARGETAALAELYAARSRHPEAARLAARVLLVVAADSTVREEGRRLLERAVALDGRDGAVRRVVALAYEREARYEEAVAALAELVERDPGDAEARLRLALNLARVGRTDAAAAHLEHLMADRQEPWILTLAFQELARLRTRTGRGGEAVALLRRAIDRLPGEPRLVVQLAYLLDRGGAPEEARRWIATLAPADGASARLRYSATAAFDEIRRSLTEQVQLRLAALARALDRHDGGTSDTTAAPPTRRKGDPGP